MDSIGQEIRHAARRLRRSPAFTVAAVLTLALAIGANASIFAVVQRVVLNPLPYPDSDRLIELDHGALVLNLPANMGITLGLYYYYSDRARTLDGVALYRTDDLTLTGDGAERVRCARATPTLAAVLQTPPAIGRWFTEEDGRPGAPPVAVLTHALWARRYDANPGILGRPVMLGGVATEIVGVMPASFAFPDPRVGVWVAEPLARSMGFGLWNYTGVARLRGGATLADARAELNGLIAEVPKAYPGDPFALGNVETRLFFSGRTLKDATLGSVARGLWILLASVGVVLLVACANVANLFLVGPTPATAGSPCGVRSAPAPGPHRAASSPSVLLSIAGGAIGLLLAWGAVRLLVANGPATLPQLHEIRLDGVAIAFTCALSLAAAFGFGAIPLWRGAGRAAALPDGAGQHREPQPASRPPPADGGAVAMALVLLVSSGLMVRSVQKLRDLDPGFDAVSALTFSIGLPDRQYPTRDSAVAAHHAILDRLSALPGVTAATASTCLPLTGACSGNTVRVEGRPIPPGTVPPIAMLRAVAGGYFETMGMHLVHGRGITRADVDHFEPVVVVNQSLATQVFPGQDPVGKYLTNFGPATTKLQIVGLVGNVRHVALETAGRRRVNPMPQIFMPLSIAGRPGIPRSSLIGPDIAVMSYVIRSRTPPLGLLPSVRRAVDGVDKDLALAQVSTLQDILDRASAQMAFTMALLVPA
jgi:predicted permease